MVKRWEMAMRNLGSNPCKNSYYNVIYKLNKCKIKNKKFKRAKISEMN